MSDPTPSVLCMDMMKITWSNVALLPWGKTDRKDGMGTAWLPLVTHLTDSALVGGHLYDHWLSDSQRRLVGEAVGPASAKSLVMFLCGIHDIGKCAPSFAAKALDTPGFGHLAERMRDAGFHFNPQMWRRDRLAPHGLIGQVIVARELAARGFPKPLANTFACIVGGHHGANPLSPEVRAVEAAPTIQVGDGLWVEVQGEIWNTMAAFTGADAWWAQWSKQRLSPPLQVMLTGLVIVADWMASNVELFPYDTAGSPDRLASAIEQLDLPQQWRPPAPKESASAMLEARFPTLAGLDPHPIQQALFDAARTTPEPALFIVEAQMGAGKTEAALVAAEVLAHRFGLGGTFFGLPTMATSNPMFGRVKRWLEQVGGAATELNLVHGKAALNKDFAGMARHASIRGIEDESDTRAEVVAASWFRGRKLAALAKHMVGTIDQGLFAALKAKHVVLRQLAMVGKVVVIDEVHAADEFMLVYLQGLLEWLGAYSVPVVLMSATLPPARRIELAEAYAKGRAHKTVKFVGDGGDQYPRLSVVNEELRDWPVEQSRVEQSVELRLHDDDDASIVASVSTLTERGGCVGVICNTVKRAQRLYAALRDRFADDVVLVHSKFVAQHRALRERDLVDRLGRRGQRPERLIVVGTQVLEQSLDIDFDVLFTEVAPMDLLMQRIGRMHRHQRGPGQSERPQALRGATCYVFGVPDVNACPPELGAGSKTVYGAAKLLRTLAVLEGGRTITLPKDIPTLVRRAYDPALSAPDGWEPAWSEAENQAHARAERKHADARAFLLRSPWDPTAPNLNGLIDHATADPEAPRGAARARVRDSDESVEVLVVQRDSAGQLRTLDGIGEMAGQVVPSQLGDRDWQLARVVAQSSVALPRELVANPRQADATVAALEAGLDVSGWQNNPWLAGELFLVIEPDGHAEVAGVRLAYDTELGLRVLAEERGL